MIYPDRTRVRFLVDMTTLEIMMDSRIHIPSGATGVVIRYHGPSPFLEAIVRVEEHIVTVSTANVIADPPEQSLEERNTLLPVEKTVIEDEARNFFQGGEPVADIYQRMGVVGLEIPFLEEVLRTNTREALARLSGNKREEGLSNLATALGNVLDKSESAFTLQ
jgi:hypothetical protein